MVLRIVMKVSFAFVLLWGLVVGSRFVKAAYGAPATPRCLLLGTESPVEKERLRELIRQLGDPDWKQREEAQRKIAEMGTAALSALKEASGNPDPEVAFRAKELLSTLNPLEARVALVRLEGQSGVPGMGRITEKLVLRSNEGGKTGSRGGIYKLLLEGKKAASAGMRLGIGWKPTSRLHFLQLRDLEAESWSVVERRMRIRWWREGVHMEYGRLPSVLLMWAEKGKRLEIETAPMPLDLSSPGGDLRRELVRELLSQLGEDRELSVRLSAARILGLLGVEKARAPLKTLKGQPVAEAALARLGVKEAEKRLVDFVCDPQTPFSDKKPVLFALASLGKSEGARLLWENLGKLYREEIERAAWLLGDCVLREQLQIPGRGNGEILASLLSDSSLTGKRSVCYLLWSLARREPGLLLGPLKDAVKQESVTSYRTGTRNLLYLLRVVLAGGAVSHGEAKELAAVTAPYTLGANYIKALQLLPYLVEYGGGEALKPFLKTTDVAFSGSDSPYYVRKTLTALALFAPPGSSVREQLFNTAKKGLYSSKASQARRSVEALSFLLEKPYGSRSSSSVERIRRFLEDRKRSSAAPEKKLPDYELCLWSVRREGERIKVQESHHLEVSAFTPVSFRDRYGNLRVVALSPTRVVKRGDTPSRIRFYSPGTSRYLYVRRPALTGLFPDVSFSCRWESDVSGYSTHVNQDDFLKMVIYVRPVSEGKLKGPVSWDRMIDEAVEGLGSLDRHSLRNRLDFFVKLRVKEAASPVKRMLHNSDSPLERSRFALTLAELGDSAGERFLVKELNARSLSRRMRAVRYLIDINPSHKRAVEALVRLIGNMAPAQFYGFTTTIRKVCRSSPEQRQKVLRALASVLTLKNVKAVTRILRSVTRFNFGYRELSRADKTSHRNGNIKKVIRRWKNAVITGETDKK